jgi:Fe-S cluster assembly iron-binding protein IscA
MNKLFIDDKAMEFIKNTLAKDGAPSMRLYISGGGCCKQFEINRVKKALAGDLTCMQSGITLHIDKEIADNTNSIEIILDEKKGLIITFE